jgi:3',5'-cyclic AMP phosphodiesterase CpdA
MVTLLHISDLHFGVRRARALVEAILRAEAEVAPDAVVCSGDLVEWSETNGPWREARAFLRRIAAPLVVIPGNHDIERFNPVGRLLWPLDRYRRFVGDVDTVRTVPGAVIVGLGTPRRWTVHLGHISRAQIALARAAFAAAAPGALKVLTLHHGLEPERPGLLREHVRGASRLKRALGEMGAHLVLSGHGHFPRVERIGNGDQGFVWAQAGTTGSHRFKRHRVQRNSLSVLRASVDHVAVEWWHYVDRALGFEPAERVELRISAWAAVRSGGPVG